VFFKDTVFKDNVSSITENSAEDTASFKRQPFDHNIVCVFKAKYNGTVDDLNFSSNKATTVPTITSILVTTCESRIRKLSGEDV